MRSGRGWVGVRSWDEGVAGGCAVIKARLWCGPQRMRRVWTYSLALWEYGETSGREHACLPACACAGGNADAHRMGQCDGG